jgi:hypothetical protein
MHYYVSAALTGFNKAVMEAICPFIHHGENVPYSWAWQEEAQRQMMMTVHWVESSNF